MAATDLLAQIKSFLAESRMGPTYFGRRAVGNSELVARLEAGRTVTLVTADAIRKYIAKRRGTVRSRPRRIKEAA